MKTTNNVLLPLLSYQIENAGLAKMRTGTFCLFTRISAWFCNLDNYAMNDLITLI